jgi:glycosyltransferase involved in cell wall biosynthesis
LAGGTAVDLQADYVLLLAAVQERIRAFPSARHILLSFFATHSGFTAQHVALALGIAHIASIRGSDFSRDFRSPHLWQAVQFVVERADVTVTTNSEQARVLEAAFPAARKCRTIHNAIWEETDSPLWSLQASPPIRLASDGGFSYKKATHVLLEAVCELLKEGKEIHLTLAGHMPVENAFWPKLQRECLGRFPDACHFPGHLPEKEVTRLLLASHIYVSASLGEGCSLSRIRALTLGMPMVVTTCETLSEIAANAQHVRQCHAGSVPALVKALRPVIANIHRIAETVDPARIQQWRKYFSRERERDAWEQVIAEITGDTSPREMK